MSDWLRGSQMSVLALSAMAMLLAHGAWACDTGTVRDAVARAKRDVHRLCVIAHAPDTSADAIFNKLDSWLHGDGQALNVTLERVNADDPNVQWRDYGIPSVPPELPVVVLAGEFQSPRRPFVIDHWQPGPSDGDLAALASSPARDAIKGALTSRWATILYAPAGGQAEPGIEAALQAVEKRWAAEQTPGVSVVRLDRTDPKERLICAFTGIRTDAPDWLGVVFGRGKLMAPPLQGDEITEQNINGLFQRLAVPCTCLQQSISYGLDIPMTWEVSLDEKIPFGDAPDPGYTEVALDSPAPPMGVAAPADEIPREERRILRMVLAALAVGGIVAASGIILIVRRNRRQDAS